VFSLARVAGGGRQTERGRWRGPRWARIEGARRPAGVSRGRSGGLHRPLQRQACAGGGGPL